MLGNASVFFGYIHLINGKPINQHCKRIKLYYFTLPDNMCAAVTN